MFWMRAYPLLVEVGGGWALEFSSFLGPVKWERADRRVPFGAQKRQLHNMRLRCIKSLKYHLCCILLEMYVLSMNATCAGGKWPLTLNVFSPAVGVGGRGNEGAVT